MPLKEVVLPSPNNISSEVAPVFINSLASKPPARKLGKSKSLSITSIPFACACAKSIPVPKYK